MELEAATTSGATTVPCEDKVTDKVTSFILPEESESDSTPYDPDAIWLTQLELNVLTQRRQQFHKTETKTVDLYQMLIEAETDSLRCLLQRHEAHGDTSIHAHRYVVMVKKMISALCVQLIVNDPSVTEHWTRYANFCNDFAVDLPEIRDPEFETLLEAATKPLPGVYVQMAYTEHNISGDYAKARSYLTRGLEAHKEAVELYVTRLQLEVGECYALRDAFSSDRVYNDADKAILLGDHVNETYELMKANVNLTEASNLEQIDTFLRTTCEEFPCYPVRQLKQKLGEHLKLTCPSHVEVVDLEAKRHLDAATNANVKDALVAMFQTYWNAFLVEKNGKIIHRAVDTFSSLDLNAAPVRRLLYLLLDIGLYYRCLEPQHVNLYFSQLRLENTNIAEMKTKLVFRKLSSDTLLNSCVSTWHVKLATFLNLYGTDDMRLAKLMPMAASSLPTSDDLLVVFCRALTRTLSKPDKATFRFVKSVFSLLLANVETCPRTMDKLRRILITWFISRGRGPTAKLQYMELKEGGREEGVHSVLLGQLLLYNPIKRDPEDD